MNTRAHATPNKSVPVHHRGLRLLVATALVAAGVVLPAGSALAADGTVTGTAFRDFGSDGSYDIGNPPGSGQPNDAPLAGVTVTAIDAVGATVGSAVTAANGAYSLTVAGAYSSALRVEFALTSAQAAEGYEPGYHGTNNGSAVQFVTIGASGVDFAANVPEDYVQDDPRAVLAVHRAADPLAAGYPTTGLATDTAVSSSVTVPWDEDGTATNSAAIEVGSTVNGQNSTGAQTGSLYGVAVFRGSTDAYATAVLRRHIGLGEAGLGGLYRIDTLTGNASVLLDDAALAGFGIDVGSTALDALVGGSGSLNDRRGLTGDPATPSHDSAVFAAIGHYGLGGLAAGSDGSTLYAINLYGKSLLVIHLDGAGSVSAIDEVDLGLGTTDVPWGVTVHRGSVFIGVIDSATDSGARADLSARVLSSAESDLATWTAALASVPLDFSRGYTSTGPGPDLSGDVASHWNPWTDDWTDAESAGFYVQTALSNPQPILSSIAFDQNGVMLVGFADRFSFQTGMVNYSTIPGDTTMYAGFSDGDLYGASANGDGTWTLESNGVLDGQNGYGVGNGRGPVGGQYFHVESAVDPSSMSGLPGHNHTPLGAVAALPGFANVLSAGYDLTGAWVSDAAWLPLDGSERTLAQRIVNNEGSSSTPEVTTGMGKAGGLGGVAILLESAPVELGNRVWFDVDQDGIQDADEPPIAGVSVTLTDVGGNPVTDANGTPVDPVFTNSGGEYYFSNLVPDQSYQVHFTAPTSGNWLTGDPTFGTVAWSSLRLTDQASGSDRGVDSNPDPTTGVAGVSLGGPGENDHTIDAGYVADAQFTIQKLIDGDGGTPAVGQSFEISIDLIDWHGESLVASPNVVTLDPDEVSSPISVPVGSRVKLTETSDPSVEVVTYGPDTDEDGYSLVSGTTAVVALTVTNRLYGPGAIMVTKAVSGDFELTDPELASLQISVTYTWPDGSSTLTLNADNDFTATTVELPYGTVVTLSETSVSGAAGNVGWGIPTWSSGDQADGTAEVTIGSGETTELTVTNPTTALTGAFEVSKSVIGDGEERVPADQEFTVQYSTDAGDTWTDLIVGQSTATLGPDLPTGTTVWIREVEPTTPVDVAWGSPVFSGSGVTPHDGYASFVIGDATTVSVLVENPTGENNGQFSVTKDVTGPGEPLLESGTEFSVQYTYEGQVGGPATITVENGETVTSPALPAGTEVTITEVTPTTGLPTGATWGTPTLTINGDAATNGATFEIGADTVVAIVVANPTDVTPTVEILKGDGAGTSITHEADTVADGEAYLPGESRTIVIQVRNTGPEPLTQVSLSDLTTAGGNIESLVWTFPDSSMTIATWDSGSQTWSASWPATFAPGTTSWAVGDLIYGTATLTLEGSASAHQNEVRVDAVGQFSGKEVDDEDPYNAFTGDIQVIKYDGERPDPVVRDSDSWVIPTKPLANANQDANTTSTAVTYPVDAPQRVRWVVTNTGTTWLTNLTLSDVTDDGPSIGDDWTADLSAFGGPTEYSFVNDGPWPGLFPPGASFFAEGTLALSIEETHADTVTVVGTIVVPKADPETGLPTDDPSLGENEEPVIARDDDGNPLTVTDDDPFHAVTPSPKVLGVTGTQVEVWVPLLAAGLLGVGTALVLVHRERRRMRS